MIRFYTALTGAAALCATLATAQSAPDTMTVTIDGDQSVLPLSTTFNRAQSRWSTIALPTPSTPIDFVDEISAIGYLLDGNAVDLTLHVYFNVWSVEGALRIEEPSIDITKAGDTGRWETANQDIDPVITLTKYERSDAGVLVEATFSGDPVYWATLYKKDEDRGPAQAVSGDFSLFFPAQ
ncbi:hypothetical protein [Celeribacter sp.]|uniref:hypothetical protein n=1 Tax=Celeribacter sp. TaxID=1890673 RepID=UPI003A8E6AB4